MGTTKWTKEHFDREFENPDPWRFFSSEYEQTKYKRQIDIMKALAASPKRILEMGCAEGAHTIMLARAFPRSQITAMDISSLAIARAGNNLAKYLNVKVEQADFTEFLSGVRDSYFDIIIWSESIYYMGDRLALRELPEFLEKVVNKLAKNGILCMANIIDQQNAPETPLTRRPLMECYYLMLSSLAEPVHRSTHLERKAENKQTHEYQIWAFRRT